jgi:hypothetical protein
LRHYNLVSSGVAAALGGFLMTRFPVYVPEDKPKLA